MDRWESQDLGKKCSDLISMVYFQDDGWKSKIGKLLFVLNYERGTGYECLKSSGLKSEPYHMKEHPSLADLDCEI